ncbi:MAG: ABC transporter permease, partial [Christensenellaceae bacterium]
MMDANNNQSAVSKIAARSYASNRSRNLVAIIAIILTAVMFTTVFTIGFSMLQSMAALGASVMAGADAQGTIIMIAGIAMILVSGYLIIYNIFQISVAQDIRFYGLLKTLGATQSQIGRILVSQAMKLCLVGIPIGLLIGYGVGALVMPHMLVSLGSMAVLSINPMIFIGSALFALITVLLSCAKPASVAGRVSPVTAMKYVDADTEAKAQTKTTRKNISLRSMAADNLGRNKKRTATVVISVSLGLMLMNSFYVMQHSYSEETYVNNFIMSDIAVSAPAANSDYEEYDEANGITAEMLEGMAAIPGISEMGSLYYTETTERINEDVLGRLTAYYDDENGGQSSWVEMNEDANRQYKALKRTGETTVSVYGMDGFTAGMGKVYVGEYDKDRFQTGNYVVALGLADNGEGSVHYEVGDKIIIAGKDYELMAMIEPAETVRGRLHSAENELEIDYAIPAGEFRRSFPDVRAASVFMDANDEESLNAAVSALEEKYPGLQVSTRQTYGALFQSQV